MLKFKTLSGGKQTWEQSVAELMEMQFCYLNKAAVFNKSCNFTESYTDLLFF